MVTDDDGSTAVEKRITDFLASLTASGPYVSPRPSVPSVKQHLASADELDRRRDQMRRDERLRARADLEVAADVRRPLNTKRDRVTLYPEM